MAKKRIRLGIIGCGGNMRAAHVPRIKSDGKVDLVAIVDAVESQAQLLREAWGSEVPYFADYKRMIREVKLDAVCISTPHSQHYEQAKFALEHDLHVLIEKPLTPSSKQAKHLLDLAEKRDWLLVVSYQRNFVPAYVCVRELLRKGVLGELRGVISYVTQNWSAVGGWRLDPEQSGGGMFMDTGSHLVTSTLWMTGLEPVEVSAFMDNAGKPVDINAVVNVRFKNGAVGTLNTIGNASRHDERIAIHGSEGCIVFHQHQWRLQPVLLNNEPLAVPPSIKENSPDQAFFDWIRNGGRGYGLPQFAVQVAKLSEAAYQSVKEKRPVIVAR
ncbi:MAG: Gfo/Idh/MocA family oxidoreductase [Armatimonadetes bacterium]|nr:Gfo/Idh/MocA family oxidoreductase [Armatimonadota bacterium]